MEKTAPCMAIAEKEGHRNGGCMNIFFQFFEWNRKFPKKNLFSKKLLLRAGEEQVSKRFGKNEKMPKPMIHLISDGYAGSLPNVRKKKIDHSNGGNDGSDDHDSSEIVEPKHRRRSPGLVARLMGLESMPAIPEENPNESSLLDKGTNREEKPPDNPGVLSSKVLSSDDNAGAKLESRSQKALQTGISDKQVMTRIRPEGLHIKDVLSRAQRHNPHGKLPSQLKGPRVLNTRDCNSSRTSRLIHFATRILEPGLQAKNKAKYTLTYSDASHFPKNRLMGNKTSEAMLPDSRKRSLMGENMVDQQCVVCPASATNHASFPPLQFSEKNAAKPVSTSFHNLERNRARAQEQVLKRDRMPTMEGRPNSHNSQRRRVSPASRTIVSSEANNFRLRNLSSDADTRQLPSRISGSKFDMERRFCARQDDSVSLSSRPAVKRREDANGNGHFRSSGSAGSQFRKEKNIKRDNGFRKEEETKLRARNRQSSSRLTSNSDSGQRTKGTRESKQMRKTVDEGNEKFFFERRMPLNGDALGALLERTLKELTYGGEEKPIKGISKPRKPTAAILQELISALTTQQLVTKSECICSEEIAFQTKAKSEGSSLGCVHGGDRCSPGCVLEASFSDNSCVSSNLEETSGDTMQPEAIVQDTANPIKKSHFPGYCAVTDLTNRVSRVLISINETGLGLKQSQLKQAEDVILKTELLFWDTRDSADGPSLLNQLMILDNSKWGIGDWIPRFREIKENDQFTRVYLFNSVMECLDSKYSMYGDFGFKEWRRLPLYTNVESLVKSETGRWIKLAGMGTDEIIGWEMNHSLGKWRDFDAEAFEAGVEISLDVLQGLVEEFVIDLWIFQPVSHRFQHRSKECCRVQW